MKVDSLPASRCKQIVTRDLCDDLPAGQCDYSCCRHRDWVRVMFVSNDTRAGECANFSESITTEITEMLGTQIKLQLNLTDRNLPGYAYASFACGSVIITCPFRPVLFRRLVQSLKGRPIPVKVNGIEVLYFGVSLNTRSRLTSTQSTPRPVTMLSTTKNLLANAAVGGGDASDTDTGLLSVIVIAILIIIMLIIVIIVVCCCLNKRQNDKHQVTVAPEVIVDTKQPTNERELPLDVNLGMGAGLSQAAEKKSEKKSIKSDADLWKSMAQEANWSDMAREANGDVEQTVKMLKSILINDDIQALRKIVQELEFQSLCIIITRVLNVTGFQIQLAKRAEEPSKMDPIAQKTFIKLLIRAINNDLKVRIVAKPRNILLKKDPLNTRIMLQYMCIAATNFDGRQKVNHSKSYVIERPRADRWRAVADFSDVQLWPQEASKRDNPTTRLQLTGLEVTPTDSDSQSPSVVGSQRVSRTRSRRSRSRSGRSRSGRSRKRSRSRSRSRSRKASRGIERRGDGSQISQRSLRALRQPRVEYRRGAEFENRRTGIGRGRGQNLSQSFSFIRQQELLRGPIPNPLPPNQNQSSYPLLERVNPGDKNAYLDRSGNFALELSQRLERYDPEQRYAPNPYAGDASASVTRRQVGPASRRPNRASRGQVRKELFPGGRDAVDLGPRLGQSFKQSSRSQNPRSSQLKRTRDLAQNDLLRASTQDLLSAGGGDASLVVNRVNLGPRRGNTYVNKVGVGPRSPSAAARGPRLINEQNSSNTQDNGVVNPVTLGPTRSSSKSAQRRRPNRVTNGNSSDTSDEDVVKATTVGPRGSALTPQTTTPRQVVPDNPRGEGVVTAVTLGPRGASVTAPQPRRPRQVVPDNPRDAGGEVVVKLKVGPRRSSATAPQPTRGRQVVEVNSPDQVTVNRVTIGPRSVTKNKTKDTVTR